MTLSQKDIEEIEYEIWIDHHQNPLPRLNDIEAAQKKQDNIYFGKPLSYIFALSVNEGIGCYLSKEDFIEMDYILNNNQFYFSDGSYIILNEADGSLSAFSP